MLVRRSRQFQAPKKEYKRPKVSKLFTQNIKTKFWVEHKYVFLGVLTIVLIGGGIGMLFFSRFFDVDAVLVERTDLMTNTAPIQTFINSFRGKNIILLNAQELEYELSKMFPELKTVEVSRLLPRTLKVKVVEYPTIARIRGFGQTKEMYLSEIGMVRDIPTKNEKLPLIEYKTVYDLKDAKLLTLLSPYLALQDRNQIMRAEELQDMLAAKDTFEKEFGLPVASIRYYPLEREIHLLTQKGFSLWLDLTEEMNQQFEKLRQALQDFNIYKIELAYVDLRISNKIIYCTPNSPCAIYGKE